MKKYHFEFYWMNRDIAKKTLEDIVDFFEEHQIQLHLDCGTLLGAYREGTFIVYDSDIDCSMTYEDFKRMQKLRLENPKAFQEAGVIVSPYLIGPDKVARAMIASKYNIKIDIYVRFEKDGYHNYMFDYKKDRKPPYRAIRFPAHFHNEPIKIPFLDREYWGPGKTDKYLAMAYGKYWTTRIKASAMVTDNYKLGELVDFIPKEILEEPE